MRKFVRRLSLLFIAIFVMECALMFAASIIAVLNPDLRGFEQVGPGRIALFTGAVMVSVLIFRAVASLAVKPAARVLAIFYSAGLVLSFFFVLVLNEGVSRDIDAGVQLASIVILAVPIVWAVIVDVRYREGANFESNWRGSHARYDQDYLCELLDSLRDESKWNEAEIHALLALSPTPYVLRLHKTVEVKRKHSKLTQSIDIDSENLKNDARDSRPGEGGSIELLLDTFGDGGAYNALTISLNDSVQLIPLPRGTGKERLRLAFLFVILNQISSNVDDVERESVLYPVLKFYETLDRIGERPGVESALTAQVGTKVEDLLKSVSGLARRPCESLFPSWSQVGLQELALRIATTDPFVVKIPTGDLVRVVVSHEQETSSILGDSSSSLTKRLNAAMRQPPTDINLMLASKPLSVTEHIEVILPERTLISSVRIEPCATRRPTGWEIHKRGGNRVHFYRNEGNHRNAQEGSEKIIVSTCEPLVSSDVLTLLWLVATLSFALIAEAVAGSDIKGADFFALTAAFPVLLITAVGFYSNWTEKTLTVSAWSILSGLFGLIFISVVYLAIVVQQGLDVAPPDWAWHIIHSATVTALVFSVAVTAIRTIGHWPVKRP